jgi:hypothetical protein
MEGLREGSHRGRTTPTDQVFLFFCTSDKNHNVKNKEFFISNNNFYLKNYFLQREKKKKKRKVVASFPISSTRWNY